MRLPSAQRVMYGAFALCITRCLWSMGAFALCIARSVWCVCPPNHAVHPHLCKVPSLFVRCVGLAYVIEGGRAYPLGIPSILTCNTHLVLLVRYDMFALCEVRCEFTTSVVRLHQQLPGEY